MKMKIYTRRRCSQNKHGDQLDVPQNQSQRFVPTNEFLKRFPTPNLEILGHKFDPKWHRNLDQTPMHNKSIERVKNWVTEIGPIQVSCK